MVVSDAHHSRKKSDNGTVVVMVVAVVSLVSVPARPAVSSSDPNPSKVRVGAIRSSSRAGHQGMSIPLRGRFPR